MNKKQYNKTYIEKYTSVRILKTTFNEMQKVKGIEKWDNFLLSMTGQYKKENISLDVIELEINKAIKLIINRHK